MNWPRKICITIALEKWQIFVESVSKDVTGKNAKRAQLTYDTESTDLTLCPPQLRILSKVD